jgi:aspartyl-tRNA(Asn)/glutamyl-tRNA(Gln) amidotransferase subunit B
MTSPELSYTPLIGMEVHVQLATRSKMFCRCAVGFGAPPNSLVCPVCLGLPGALPVINRRAVELAVQMGLALSCRIAPFTKWDRKSYYYPDLPKNYQISQYDLPLAAEGTFEFEVGDQIHRVGIIRAHLEEDAGKNLHELPNVTQVDLNRAGTPLLEIVTRPELHSAEEAYAFCTQLQHLTTYLGIGEGSMQKGQMRFEPNVNLLIGSDGLSVATPICEIKNLNSFRAVKAAVDHEIRRHLETYRRDPTYTRQHRGRENRGWDEDRGQTVFQRGKEEAHDYRYFPDPDLVPVELDPRDIERLRAALPELPAPRTQRLVREAGLSQREACQIITDRASADLFDAAVQAGADPRTLARQFISFWSKLANARGCTVAGLGVEAGRAAELARMTAEGRISASAAAQLAEAMLQSPAAPADLARAHGLEQVQDRGALEVYVDQAIAANPKAVDEVRARGKKWEKSLSFLQGQVMRLSGGAASPQLVREILERKFSD